MTIGIDIPWTKMIEPELLSLTDNTLRLKQSPKTMHLNHNGDMHAGVIFSMAEMAGMGIAVMVYGDLDETALVVVKNIDIAFIARAQGEIIFTGAITDRQRKDILQAKASGADLEEVINVEATDTKNTIVSEAKVTIVIKPPKDKMSA